MAGQLCCALRNRCGEMRGVLGANEADPHGGLRGVVPGTKAPGTVGVGRAGVLLFPVLIATCRDAVAPPQKRFL